MILKRILVLSFTGLVILTSMASCSLPGFNPSKSDATLGVLKYDPSITTIKNSKGETIPFNGMGRSNNVKIGKDENGKDVIVENGLGNISVQKIVQTGYNKYFILTYEKGIFQTTNGARDWERRYIVDEEDEALKISINDKIQITAMSADRVNSYLYLGAVHDNKTVIYFSRDDGYTFQQIYSSPSSEKVANIVQNPSNAYEIFVAFDNSAIIKTQDEGKTWSKLPTLPDKFVQLGYLKNSRQLFALTNSEGIAYLENDKWKMVDNLDENGKSIRKNQQIYISETQSSENPKSYILVADDKLYIKKSEKENFKEIKLPISSEKNQINAVQPIFSANSQKYESIWVAVESNLYKSSNEGLSWQANDQIRNSDIGQISDFLVDSDDQETFYVTLSNKIKRSFSLF